MATFDPLKDPGAFRDALGRFATGVTVVTALEGETPIGITANSFASLSLDPALTLWSIAKHSARHDAFAEAEEFNIHVLSDKQQHVCDAFVRKRHGFDGLDYTINAASVPVIGACLAVFECQIHAVHEAGDHTLLIGKVRHVTAREGTPLLFLNGQFEACKSHISKE